MSKIKLSYNRALQLLKTNPNITPLFINPLFKTEIDAIITHWLQDIESEPAFLNGITKEDLVQYLIDNSNPPVKSNDNFQIEIDFGSLPFPQQKNPKFTFIDLFAGIGGFRIALQNLGGKCVFSSDWDKAAKLTYFNNFGEVPYGDIRLFTGKSVTDKEIRKYIPNHDILTAGFPCQPFSRAGVSARNSLGIKTGFQDEKQGNLFFDIVRIVKVKKPKVLFLENVKNLKSHDHGNTLAVIKETIEKELGYSFHFKIINAQTVVPQKRERCYMVCFRDKAAELEFKFEFPDFNGEPLPLKSILEENVSDAYTISDRLWAGHQNRSKRNIERGTGFTAFEANLEKPANTLVARYGKDGKECLVPQKNKNPRKLTRRECARLMGFPDNFIVAESNAAAYRQFGNSLVSPVVQKIAKKIIIKLEE